MLDGQGSIPLGEKVLRNLYFITIEKLLLRITRPKDMRRILIFLDRLSPSIWY